MPSQSESAYNKIKNAIAFGELKPGERLIEKRICENFKIGRTPLREAIRRLQTEGYVDFIPNKGATISKLSVRDVEEIYNTLAVLEGYATELATNNLSDSKINKLKALHKDMVRLATKKDYKNWLVKNSVFHGCIAKACGNKHLAGIIKDLRDRIYRYRFLAVSIAGQSEIYLKHHEAILQALYNNNAIQAGKKMRMHGAYVGKVAIDLLKQSPGL